MKNKDNKKTLTEKIEGQATTYARNIDEQYVARVLSMDLRLIVDEVNDAERGFDKLALSRAAQESVQILKNSEVAGIRDVANELSEILRKGGSNAQKLANIINESDEKYFQKGCLELYEDIADYLQPLANFDDSKQAQLETKILEKLPERIKEAKYERTLSFEKVENVIEKLVNGTKGGRLAYLKAEFSKLDVAGKILAAAATAAAIAATPIVLGVGLAGTAVVGAAAPLAGAGYVANELKKAYDEEVRNERQKLADEKKSVVPNYEEGHEYITDLLKGLIDLAVVYEQLKMLKVAIEQHPKLRDEIPKGVLDIIEKSTTTTDKLWNQGELIKAIEGLGEDAAKKLLTLVKNIREPKSEKLSPEEVRYFHALRKLITNGLDKLIKSIFSNKVITAGSNANKAFLSGIDQDKFPDVRDMLKNCSELDKAGGDQLYEALELKILEANQPEEPKLLEVNPSIDTLNIFNILDKRNPTDNELKLLKDAFNSLSPEAVKGLAEKSDKLLTQQKQEEKGKGFLDKAKSFLNITSTQKAAREEKSR